MAGWQKHSITLLLVTSFVMFGFGELAIRLLMPQATYSDLLALTGEQYRDGGFIPFTLKPCYEAKAPSMEHPGRMVTVRTNSLGLRGRETSTRKPRGVKRILVLGDSYTFGVYCENDEAYPAVLEALCNREGAAAVEVINAGYADGWGPDQHYAWLLNRGIGFQPDIVIYGFFIGNDIADIDSSKWAAVDKRGLPVKLVDPEIYIDDLGRIHSRVRDEKTVGQEGVYRIPLFRQSHLFILLNRAVQRLVRIGAGRKASGGWGTAPFDAILDSSLSKENQGKDVQFLKLVGGMREVANSNGAQFLLLMIPVNFQVEPEAFLKKVLGSDKYQIRRDYFAEVGPVLDRAGIEHLNLLSLMKDHPEGTYYPRNGEVHFSPNGHRFAANALKEKLVALGWIGR
jgi:lysophospholipase L1-like esterase